MSTFFIPNCDFDFRLNNENLSPKIERAVAEMAALFSPMLESDDTIYSSFEPLHSFCEYLSHCEIPCASFAQTPENYQHIDAWGWNSESTVFQGDHPSLPVVEEVNSRRFSYEVGKKYGFTLKGARILFTSQEWQTIAPHLLEGEWVLKPLYGNAGSGFIRGKGCDRLVEELSLCTAPMLFEPWKERITDIASSVTISQDGTITINGHHRNISNRAGAFYANLLAPKDPLIAPYKDILTSAVTAIAQELVAKGYYGAVGIDSFVYTEGGEEKLCIGFDINARHAISSISYGVRQKIGKERVLLYRFIARRRMIPILTYEELQNILGDLHYSPKTGKGVILLSPLQLQQKKEVRIPARFAFGIVADSIEAVFALDKKLRERVLKQKREK